MRIFPANSLVLLSLVAALAALSACAPPTGLSTGAGASGLTTSEKENSGSSEISSASVPDPARTVESAAVEDTEVQLNEADLSQLEQIIKSHNGKVIVVDVWSTSCAPCMREFPHLVELSQTATEHLMCVSLNVDYIGLKSKPPEFYQAKVQGFLQQQHAIKITNLLSSSADEAVLSHFNLASIPAILIYAADGTLTHSLTDANSGEDGLTYEGDVIPKVMALMPSK